MQKLVPSFDLSTPRELTATHVSVAEEYRRRQTEAYARHASDAMLYGAGALQNAYPGNGRGLANIPYVWAAEMLQKAQGGHMTPEQRDLFVLSINVDGDKPREFGRMSQGTNTSRGPDYGGEIAKQFTGFQNVLADAVRYKLRWTASAMSMPEPMVQTIANTLGSVVFERTTDQATWAETICLTILFKFPDNDVIAFPRKFDLEGGDGWHNPFEDDEVWEKLVESMQLTETEILQLASAL